ncbi:hypothetical protein V9T40_008798 [Parthenolecanium corni]|uniref:Integrase catalytic domain-containing protein n=1 Tax=Parthenolecanium corni TaxID=536013 RepID=A0AAN9TMF5_9HEMI
MASSAHNVSRIKRFDGSNYLAWRNRVYTELQCEDLTELVDQKPTENFKKKDFGTQKKPLTWGQADARARRVIVENLEDSILHYAPTDVSAYEIWRRIKTTYNRSSYLQHAYLRRKLSNLQYDGKSELSLFFRDFDDIIAEIRSSGGKVGKIDDVEAVVTLLAALPSDYSPVIASLGEINENNLVTLETVKGYLLDYDLKRKDERKVKRVDQAETTNAAYYSDSQKDGRGEKVRCSYCNREGHRETRCFKKRNDKKTFGDTKQSGEANVASKDLYPRAVSFLAENNNNKPAVSEGDVTVELEFVADSGCTRFMINRRSVFSSCQRLEQPMPITLADNSSTHATHIGNVDLVSNLGKLISLKDVLLVPGLRRNLLSVRRIAMKSFDVVFKAEMVEIVKDGEVLASGYVQNELYFMNFKVCSSAAGLSEAGLTYTQLHRRLGHAYSGAVVELKKRGLVQFRGEIPSTCESCVRGKQCQLPYPSSHHKTSRPLEQVVSDVCFAEKASYDGFEYFVTFLDVYTHFSVVYMLRKKSEVFSKLQEYEAMVSAQFKTKISSFLCDNGREFINSDVIEFCKQKGIRLINSVPYNHQQNGRAERLNRTLEDRARTMLLESGLPKTFWSEAILCSNYLLNRCPTQSTGKIPAEEWYGNSLDFGKLRPFGCICYVHVPKEKRLKFDSRSNKGVMVGYAPMGYRIYNLTEKRLQIARNVVFDEEKFYCELLPVGTKVERAPESDGETSSDDEMDHHEADDSVIAPDLPIRTPEAAVRRSSRERRVPTHLQDYEVTVGYCEALLVEDPDDPKWDKAKEIEMKSMSNFGVWELVPRRPGMKVIRSKWALREKPDKLKARLVAVGCDERNFPDLLFSPVVNMTTVKVLLSLVVQKGLKLHQMDVSYAFLHGDLDYDVFMEQAPGFGSNRDMIGF